MALTIKQQIEKKGSQVYSYTSTTAFTSTVTEYKSFEDDLSVQPYLPFTQVKIVNNNTSNVDIIFRKNGSLTNTRLVKANSFEIITDEPIVSFALVTKSGTASVGDIRVELTTQPITEDTKLREEIGNPFAFVKKLLPVLPFFN